MGAFDSTEFALGRYKNAEEAYNELVEEAEYDYGHEGYNGTISTSSGFFIRKDAPRYDTKKFWKFVDNTMDGTKFNAWNCIEIKGAILNKKVKNPVLC